jgi:hypothetical protein
MLWCMLPGWTVKKLIQVGTLRDPKGGIVVATYEIPDELKGLSKLEIVVVNSPLNTHVSLTFDNQNKH